MSNSFFKELGSVLNERFSIDSTDMSMSDWITQNTTLNKMPFSFEGYEFQKQICDDMHPDLSCIKISQVGLTEIQFRKALAFLVRNRGTSLLFSLPSEDMFERVSKARIKPMVAADKVFNTVEDSLNRAVRSTELMQFGGSFLYMVAAVESAATSISADFVMNDELDLSDQRMIALFNSRLQGSKYRLSQKFSTPTFPNYGIDLNWQTSDQHHYMCRCNACGHSNYPEFSPKFIHLEGAPDMKLEDIRVEYKDELDFDKSYVKCERCHAPLDLYNPENRFWLPKHPNRKDSRGYRVGPFDSQNISLRYIFKQLWEYQKNEYLRGFHNTVLGLPYSDGNTQISLELIARAIKNPATPDLNLIDRDMFVGVDMGQVCHVVVMAQRTGAEGMDIMALYQVKSDDIVEFCKDLAKNPKIRGGCVDRHPYEPTAKDIMAATNGKIVPTEYRGNKDLNFVNDEYGTFHHAQVNHTVFLDAVATIFKKGLIEVHGYGHMKQVFIEHIRDMVREEAPDKPAQWRKLTGNDHFFHATGFALLAPKVHQFILSSASGEMRSLAIAQIMTMGNNGDDLIGFSTSKPRPIGLL